MTEAVLRNLLEQIEPLYEDAMARSRQRMDNLIKPKGSLGRLEDIAIHVAGILGEVKPKVHKKAVVVMVGDHGIVKRGVSLYPQEVTAQMVHNFVAGGAAISVLCRHSDVRLIVVDIGVAADIEPTKGLLVRKVGYGTRDFSKEPAMTKDEALRAIGVGIDVVEQLISDGTQMLALGDMGIGNTASSAAITAVLAEREVAEVTGRGTGLDDKQWQHKVAVIREALRRLNPDPSDPLDLLAKVGGFEIAGLLGAVIALAMHRKPIVVDGFITATAAAIGVALQPRIRDYLLAGHLSAEPGHKVLLSWMGLEPILQLNMRLGEGTGAVLAMHIIDAACQLLSEMATFEEAGVSKAQGQRCDTLGDSR